MNHAVLGNIDITVAGVGVIRVNLQLDKMGLPNCPPARFRPVPSRRTERYSCRT